jgi:hypothetical protein
MGGFPGAHRFGALSNEKCIGIVRNNPDPWMKCCVSGVAALGDRLGSSTLSRWCRLGLKTLCDQFFARIH